MPLPSSGRHKCQQLRGCEWDEAVHALAYAYYKFAKEHLELYKVILSLPMMKNDALLLAAGDIVEPIMGACPNMD